MGFDTPGKWSGGPFSVSNGVSRIRIWSGGPIPPRTPPHGPGVVVKQTGVGGAGVGLEDVSVTQLHLI